MADTVHAHVWRCAHRGWSHLEQFEKPSVTVDAPMLLQVAVADDVLCVRRQCRSLLHGLEGGTTVRPVLRTEVQVGDSSLNSLLLGNYTDTVQTPLTTHATHVQLVELGRCINLIANYDTRSVFDTRYLR